MSYISIHFHGKNFGPEIEAEIRQIAKQNYAANLVHAHLPPSQIGDLPTGIIDLFHELWPTRQINFYPENGDKFSYEHREMMLSFLQMKNGRAYFIGTQEPGSGLEDEFKIAESMGIPYTLTTIKGSQST